jgi:hypothetical protein
VSAPRTRYDPSPEVCGTSELHLFAPGEPLEGAYTLDAGGVCTSVEESTWTYFAIGDELPLDDFAPIELAWTGTGRVRSRVFKDGAGAEVWRASFGLLDAARDVECWSQRFADGRLRCVPSSAVYSIDALDGVTYFADDACTEHVVFVNGDTCGPATDVELVVSYGTCSSTVVSAHAIGAEVDPGALWYQGPAADDPCAPAGAVGGGGYKIHVRGAPLEPSVFPLFEEITE